MTADAVSTKLSILLTPATRQALDAEARERGTSVGDIVRRRIDGEPGEDGRLFVAGIVDLGRRAREAAATLDATRAALVADMVDRPERDAIARRLAVKGFAERDRVALARLVRPPQRPSTGKVSGT